MSDSKIGDIILTHHQLLQVVLQWRARQQTPPSWFDRHEIRVCLGGTALQSMTFVVDARLAQVSFSRRAAKLTVLTSN